MDHWLLNRALEWWMVNLGHWPLNSPIICAFVAILLAASTMYDIGCITEKWRRSGFEYWILIIPHPTPDTNPPFIDTHIQSFSQGTFYLCYMIINNPIGKLWEYKESNVAIPGCRLQWPAKCSFANDFFCYPKKKDLLFRKYSNYYEPSLTS